MCGAIALLAAYVALGSTPPHDITGAETLLEKAHIALSLPPLPCLVSAPFLFLPLTSLSSTPRASTPSASTHRSYAHARPAISHGHAPVAHHHHLGLAAHIPSPPPRSSAHASPHASPPALPARPMSPRLCAGHGVRHMRLAECSLLAEGAGHAREATVHILLKILTLRRAHWRELGDRLVRMGAVAAEGAL
mmetsp:Transcript_26272/g.52704  ORF Transcript_26272/g.52704 Transcript_26272/m.52704 type:complete len:192 (-) Transcript_26272:1575-2150(-)